MEHKNHKAIKPDIEPPDSTCPPAGIQAPEPLVDSHKPLEEIPAHDGGKGSLPWTEPSA